MRTPVVAGQFYPADKKELEKTIKNFLVKEKKENVKAAIVPHAGYVYSGKLAGEVLSIVPEKKDFIMLGVNHTGLGGKVCFSLEDWETPLGIVKTNKDLAEKIMHKLKHEEIEAEVNEIAHAEEHSLEVQLPFLQLSQKKFEIIPIILSNLAYEECKKIAEILADFVKDNELVVVSSDFTHYGSGYGFLPFINDVKENLYKLDDEIILQILRKDSKSFYHLASKSTVCGLYGITVLTEIARIKGWKPRLIEYYTSGDIVGEWSSSVGYAGLVFE
jgi:hypothetical protein